MKSSSKIGNSAYRKMLRDRQDKRNDRVITIGVVLGILLVLVMYSLNHGENSTIQEGPGNFVETDAQPKAENVISKYASGRSIEEIDALIEDSSTSK